MLNQLLEWKCLAFGKAMGTSTGGVVAYSSDYKTVNNNETTTETTNANNHDLPLNLADVLLNDHIMVFEPLWTLIPSNKAILPVLWRMFPNHPYLLNADYALNDELKDNGYVS